MAVSPPPLFLLTLHSHLPPCALPWEQYHNRPSFPSRRLTLASLLPFCAAPLHLQVSSSHLHLLFPGAHSVLTGERCLPPQWTPYPLIPTLHCHVDSLALSSQVEICVLSSVCDALGWALQTALPAGPSSVLHEALGLSLPLCQLRPSSGLRL